MRIRLTSALIIPALALSAAAVAAQSTQRVREFYQGRRGPVQADTFSRKIKLGRNGHVSVSNVSGRIIVMAGPGDDVIIDAVKRSRGDRGAIERVSIVVEEHEGRVDVRTDYPRYLFRGDDNVAVDYTLTVPADAALDVFSTSGDCKIDGVKGSIRLGTVSGNITTTNTPRVEHVRTVSGELDLAGISHDDSLSVTTVSGNVRAAGFKARAIDISTVSGEIVLRDAAAERLNVKSVSGSFEYAGTLARNGRYDVNSHSGSVRFEVTGGVGFELNAASFSGSVRSDYPMTVGGDRNPQIRGAGRGRSENGMRATYADGSAALSLRTFSGNITIAKK